MRRPLGLLASAVAGLLLAGCCCPRTGTPCPDPCAARPSIESASGAPVGLAPTVVEVRPAPAALAGAPYNATCPVMLGNPVDPAITTTWDGKIVGFCSETCRAKFLKNPEKYVKNLP
jgi:YHS domain-containing protein